ncbi:uncharacterized protein Dvar_53820 [Desulfosarcina variabilis str. Montpellier]|uniref:hypothetical protein n=1 Tax=Desulfosarcina variabilis TaxID=2300 RepID=UPI003AFADD65
MNQTYTGLCKEIREKAAGADVELCEAQKLAGDIARYLESFSQEVRSAKPRLERVKIKLPEFYAALVLAGGKSPDIEAKIESLKSQIANFETLIEFGPQTIRKLEEMFREAQDRTRKVQSSIDKLEALNAYEATKAKLRDKFREKDLNRLRGLSFQIADHGPIRRDYEGFIVEMKEVLHKQDSRYIHR